MQSIKQYNIHLNAKVKQTPENTLSNQETDTYADTP